MQPKVRVVWGEGNPKAAATVILDNPGAREDKNGCPYICGTKQALQYGVNKAGLEMDELYVTYVLKCRPIRRYNKDTARAACLAYLEKQLQQQKPMLILCLGNTAVQSFFTDINAEVKNLRGVWHIARGYWTAVSYHPLAVRRRPNLLNAFVSDLKMFAGELHSMVLS